MNQQIGYSVNGRDRDISKLLSWLLRHSALSQGIHITEDGFVNVCDVLKHSAFVQNRCSLDDLKRIVLNDGKQRYSFRTDPRTNQLQIRANQGHSIKSVINPGLQLVDFKRTPVAIHGTYYRYWENIKINGLSRVNRVHIHFVDSSPISFSIISGFRSSCELLIYVNIEKAFKDGIQFYKSVNNIILSPGNQNGVVSTKYFVKVIDLKRNTELTY